MPGPNGYTPDQPSSTPMMPCPWHTMGYDEHPGGSPDCHTMPENIALGRVIPLGAMMAWMSMLLTEIGPLISVMWLHHLVEYGTDESKAEAIMSLTEMGEVDDVKADPACGHCDMKKFYTVHSDESEKGYHPFEAPDES